MPVTMADVIFSLVEAGRSMIMKAYPPPWWWPIGSQVRSLSLIDAYTVEILYDVMSFLAESWTLGFYIIPKHIWKPIIDNCNPKPPTAFAPDPNMIGSGPFRYASRTAYTSILLVANKPGSVVKTDEPGSIPITSPGYHAYCPIHVNAHTLLKLTNVSPYTGGDPTGTTWHMEKPYPGLTYTVTALNILNPGFPPLNQSPYITIECTNPATYPNVYIPTGRFHVFMLKNVGGGNYELYLDWCDAKLLIPHVSGVKPPEPWIVPTEFGITVENLANVTHLVISTYVSFDAVFTTETFNSSEFNTWVQLDHKPIIENPPYFPYSERVTNMSDTATYTKGKDYNMNYGEGMIQCLSTGKMEANTNYTIHYTYQMLSFQLPALTTLDRYEHGKELFNLNIPRCYDRVTVAVRIEGPPTLDDGHTNPWISQWINYTTYTWTTVMEDIGGIYYYNLTGVSHPYYKQLPVPDLKVRVNDVLAATSAFGANAGDPKWDSTCDINHDYKCRVNDILSIALMFGTGL
jgi:hypothetical protein